MRIFWDLTTVLWAWNWISDKNAGALKLLRFFDADLRLSIPDNQKGLLQAAYVGKGFLRGDGNKRPGRSVLFGDEPKGHVPFPDLSDGHFFPKNETAVFRNQYSKILRNTAAGYFKPVHDIFGQTASAGKQIVQSLPLY